MLGHLRDCVRQLLSKLGGYECEEADAEWMLAFPNSWDACLFCLRVSPTLQLQCSRAVCYRTACTTAPAHQPCESAAPDDGAARAARPCIITSSQSPFKTACASTSPRCRSLLSLVSAVQVQESLLAVPWSLEEQALPGCRLAVSDGGTILWRGPKAGPQLTL